MPRLPDTRHSLIARLSEPADVEAWSEFVGIYEQAIFRYSRSRGLQDADAWEVVQQVLLTVHQKVSQWRPNHQPGAFRCWLLRTAHRVCLHAFRDLVRCDRAAGGSGVENPIDHVPEATEIDDDRRDFERWAFCWAAGLVQREIDPVTWQAFRMTAVEGMSAAETAQRLGMKIGSVYTAKCRVIVRIRELVFELSAG